MGKIIFWLVVIFAVLFALRLVNAAKARKRATRRRGAGRAAAGEPMVRCVALRRLPAAGRRARRSPRGCRCGDARAARATVELTPPMPPIRRCQPAPAVAAVRAAAAAAVDQPIRAGASCGSSASIAPSAARCCSAPRCCSTCKRLNIAAPNAFVTGGGAVLRVRARRVLVGAARSRCRCRCRDAAVALLVGDIFFLALVMIAGGSTGAPLPILLFPQLAASGWLLRTQTAFFHAALASVVLLGLDGWRAARRPGRRARSCSRPASSASAISRRSASRVALGRYTKASRGSRRAARHRRRQSRAGQPADHPGHAGRRAGRRPERRRARPQRAGDAPARRLRPHARRHAARRILARRCTTTGGAGRRISPSRCRRSRSRRRSGCCACGSCASARDSTAAR